MSTGAKDIQSERTTPINADLKQLESGDENLNSHGCKIILLRCVKVATVFALLGVITLLGVYWLNGRTLLAEFSFQKDNVRKPVFICIEVFFLIVLIISLADILKDAVEWAHGRSRYTKDRPTHVERGVWTGIKLLSSKFNIRESLGILKFQALADIGLLTQQACRKATEETLRDSDRPDAIREDEYCINLFSGIAIQGNGVYTNPYSVPVTAIITGVKNAGKTSIFNRVMYGGYSDMKSDAIGLNFSFKTLTIDGPDMFNERKALNIEVQLFDSCISQEDICDHMSFALGNKVVLIIVCDGTDPSSIESVAPMIAQLKARGMQFHASVFVNKVDEAEHLADIRTTCYHNFEEFGLFEVSAKTGLRAAKLLFTAPVSLAKDERTFSKMKVIKNCLRSTMTDERLEDLIILATEKELTDAIDLEIAVQDWTKRKNRKLKLKLTGQKL